MSKQKILHIRIPDELDEWVNKSIQSNHCDYNLISKNSFIILAIFSYLNDKYYLCNPLLSENIEKKKFQDKKFMSRFKE